MARIIKTTPPKPQRFLLKAGLSIFLFLQIQVPPVRSHALAKLNGWSVELCRQNQKTSCHNSHKKIVHFALVTPLKK